MIRPVKFEGQFKYRDESNLNAIRRRPKRIVKTPVSSGFQRMCEIRFTLPFRKAITIASIPDVSETVAHNMPRKMVRLAERMKASEDISGMLFNRASSARQ
jgi:hypothetical protein